MNATDTMRGASAPIEERKLLRYLWVAVVIQILGRVLDSRWHASHDEFEGTSQQLTAHWLLWIGVLATLAVAAMGVRSLSDHANAIAGFRITLAGAILYVPTSVWHFIEHANGNDPAFAHVLLVIGQVGMLAGALAATVLWLRASRTRA